MKCVLVGAGRVGLTSAVCYAQFGHTVTLVDIDANKIDHIHAGNIPFLEEGLQQFLIKGLSSRSLQVRNSFESCSDAEAFIICLPTPSFSNESGKIDLSYIKQAFTEITTLIENVEKFPLIIIRSTVPPVEIRLLFHDCFIEKGIQSHLVLNPEFLREGSAVDDFFHPPLTVVGGDNPEAVQRTLSLYERIDGPKHAVSLETAALLKYACNAFHALKISFANEIGRLASQTHADGNEVMRILASDKKLNASSAYLNPGFAFGGPCLIKDLSALLSIAQSWGIALPLLENILPSNEMHLKNCVDAIVNRGVKKVGMIGVSFKPGTGDVRNSPYIAFAQLLETHNISLKMYDAEVLEFSHADTLRELLHSSDLIVLRNSSLTQNDRDKLRDSKLPMLDLEQISIDRPLAP